MGLKESGLRGSLRNVSVGIDAIPDSVVTRHDSTEEPEIGSITTAEDVVAEFDLTGSCEVIDDGINGLRTYRLDGSNDDLENTDITVTEEPFAVLLLARLPNPPSDDSNHYFDAVDSDGNARSVAFQADFEGQHQIIRGEDSSTKADDQDADAHVWILKATDNNRLTLEKDGSDVIDEELSEGDIHSMLLGNESDGGRRLEFDFVEHEIMEGYTQDELDSERQRLADKGGISL